MRLVGWRLAWRRGRETLNLNLNLNLTCSEGSAQEEEGDKGWGE
jgi:hypothetical protein